MAITIDPQDARIFDGNHPFKFLRDAEYDWAPPLCGFDDLDEPVLGRFTADGKLKVDATFSGSITIGDVSVLLKVGAGTHKWDGVLNPDTTTYAGYVQDQRMTFSLGSLNVEVANLGQVETDLENIFDAVRGLSPIQTTVAYDANDLVATIVETDGILTKTSTVTRDVDDKVIAIGEVTV